MGAKKVSGKAWWERRYARGGVSGPGSVGRGRAWKWKVMGEYVDTFNHVVDVGCGDLSFWGGRHCQDYVGIDVAANQIKKNRKKRPQWRFIAANAAKRINGVKGNIVFCFDLLFHIMNDRDFVEILKNLCYYSDKWIFVYTWSINPFKAERWQKLGKTVTDDKFQYYRSLRKYLKIFYDAGFNLVSSSFPPWGGIGEIFIFKKREG